MKMLSVLERSRLENITWLPLFLFVSSVGVTASLLLTGRATTTETKASSDESAAFPPSSHADRLPNLILPDQYGKVLTVVFQGQARAF